MSIIFIDLPGDSDRLLPLTYTRPIAELRSGILKIREKWSLHLDETVYGFDTASYLQGKFPSVPIDKDTIFINGTLLPDLSLAQEVRALEQNEGLFSGDNFLASRGLPYSGQLKKVTTKHANLRQIRYPWDLITLNEEEIRSDFHLLTATRKSQPLDDKHTIVYGNQLFVESGVKVRAAVINTEEGPVYLGKDCEIQEGALIKGPIALCEHSVVNMGAKIRPHTTVGPHSKVGGEVSGSVIQGFSNKAHDGFLGNSVLGEWCNLGADTNNSNLKNNYQPVKMWDYSQKRYMDTGLQFCGLIMGDHSKSAINTMFNTGTSVGVAANIFGAGFPHTLIPSFTWGGASGMITYQLDKALETAEKVMARRKMDLEEEDIKMLTHIFEETAHLRTENKR